MEWKGTGSGTFYDKSQARQHMRKLSEMCDYCVRFRIELTAAIPTPEEKEWLKQEEATFA